MFGKEACPARSGVIGGIWEGGLSHSQWSHWGVWEGGLSCWQWSLGVFGKEARSFLKELGQRVKMSSGDPMPYGTTSGAANLSGCTKRECCCSAEEYWAEGRGLVVFWWWCYSGGFLLLLCIVLLLLY